MPPPETCPVCGADIPPNAKACPQCGACEKTGWSEDAYASNLDLPDQEFDYDDFIKREFPTGKNPRPPGISWFWWLIAIGVIAACLLGLTGLSF